jgi:hypothetical protein
MASRRTLKRVVTCQGSIQLIAALSVLNQRDGERGAGGVELQDHLVIYDLCAPAGQVGEFAAFIRRMATLAHDWESIVYVEPGQLSAIAEDLSQHGPESALGRVYGLLGVRDADEIYLSRNWQFGNQLFINAFAAAEKICYGDSIGIYFSEAYFSPPAPKAPAATNGFSLRGKLRGLKGRLVRAAEPPRALKEVGFEVGYFLLPDILGESPPMKTAPLESRHAAELFQKLSVLLEEEQVARVRGRLDGRPAVILMTSNFSEAGRMTVEDELSAYVKFLDSSECPPDSVLVVKPHPRDGAEKIRRLKSALGDRFAEVIVLDEMGLFFLPFEIFLLRVFTGADGEVSRGVKVVTFSTACLSLALLFNLEPLVGFGPELVEEHFRGEHAPGRVRHERDLRLAIRRIAEGAGSPYEVPQPGMR